MDDFLLATGLVLGITQVAKMTGMNTRYAPVFALVIGCASMLALRGITGDNALDGIIAGLSAIGLWSGTKNTVK